tara:strand:+ start:640 stop:861 length:222 start_codon:yes stop_codon:yes gene_type:complete
MIFKLFCNLFNHNWHKVKHEVKDTGNGYYTLNTNTLLKCARCSKLKKPSTFKDYIIVLSCIQKKKYIKYEDEI